ncbi:sulfotransferase 2B1-like [Eublepharis macularius]|uniref:Sulfotransferase n=1 Tax=Eublepharis macularius TaxID=481883 RepID=A0AA97JB42_EUBMA|nr:sulfotransferase 2B1-like [Eublepharis macularius]XP_054834967.1 sulfotransferase 2B1-like [Eublepharis macularius]
MSSAAYFTHKGISFPIKELTEESISYVENEFQVLDDDVFNVAYPKSGTNWMAEILGLIRYYGDPSWVRSLSLFQRTPWIETVHGLQVALKSPPPRLLSTHLQSQLFPKSFLRSKAKVIYTLRNPKDVLVSHYHFSKIFKLWKDPGTLEDLLEEFLTGNVPFGSWFDHVKGWIQMKDRDNFFFITYEELQQDLRGSVERICHFLGKELNSQQIDSVVENASFQKMKDNKMSNFTELSEKYMDHKKGKLLRKGICGDWKNHLTVAQSEHFDRVYQENMQGMNMTFPWD